MVKRLIKFFKKLIYLFIITFLRIVWFLIKKTYLVLVYIISNTKPLQKILFKILVLVYKFLFYVLVVLLFFFTTIPLWLCGEYIVPFVYKPIKEYIIFLMGIDNFLGHVLRILSAWRIKKISLLKLSIERLKNFLKNFLKKSIKIYRNFVWIYLYKNFIDFLFFNLKKYKEYYLGILEKFTDICVGALLFFIVFYYNLFNMFYNFIFSNFLDIFTTSAELGDNINKLIIFTNFDNLFLYMYIVFFKIGLFDFLFSIGSDINIKVDFLWTELYFSKKLSNINFSFFSFFVDEFCIFYNQFLQNLSADIGGFWKIFCTNGYFFFGTLFFSSVIFSWFFFSYLGLYGVFILNLTTLFFFWVSLLLFAKYIFVDQGVFIIKLCNWTLLGFNNRLDFYFLIDTVSFSFILLTTTIALFVYIFAFSYFKYEPLVDRFLLFLLSFVISMIFLVASGNIIMLFLGWELIGFTSFCLINFWTTKTATLKSAFKAFTFNKISDFFLFIFLIASFSIYNTTDITNLNNLVFINKQNIVYLFSNQISSNEFLAILLVGAAFIKSAQIGGHVWLPDSMEAPVPASSLIHSATLVSAGVYLILRFNPVICSTELVKFIIPVVGSITAAYGGVCAVAQSDIKKTLAYSTISHCGFLMVLCATQMNEFTILYLYVHGFFKAGVFMCVGNVLRVTRGYQDTRRMGGLLKYLPFEYFCIIIGLINLAGLPFTLGFMIKHLLIISLGGHIYIYYFVLFNSLVGAFAGLFYSYRLLTYTFNDFKKSNKITYQTLNAYKYSSRFYTNSSLAPTLAIFCLFVSAYVIIYCMFFFFLKNNSLFSDYLCLTTLTNYYSMVKTPHGFLLNFSYMNIFVIFVVFYLIFSKFRGVCRPNILLLTLFTCFLFYLYFYIFVSIF